MRNTFLILFLLFFSVTFVNAQMNTDNSYLRKNYQESKTAKKAAERKARRQALKEARRQKKAETQKDSQKDTLKNTETLTLSSSKYLEGAISTTKDGVVFFEKLFPVGAKSKQQIFDVLKMYAEKKISETEESSYNQDWTEQENYGNKHQQSRQQREEKEKGLFEKIVAENLKNENGKV